MPLLALLIGCLFISDADLADRMDLDGDGIARPADCDDGDPTIGAALSLFEDSDGDGYGIGGAVQSCELSGLAEVDGDCNDGNPDAHPDAEEICNESDDDCDGEIDEGIEIPSWFLDGDSDGYGKEGSEPVLACTKPDGHADNAADCDDLDAFYTPDTRWYPDADEDLFGVTADEIAQCDEPEGHVLLNNDCDDADPAINPYADEICDEGNVDEDCNGLSDDDDGGVVGEFRLFYADSDLDGWGDPKATAERCDAAEGWLANGRDCDDGSEAIGDCGWQSISVERSTSCGLLGSGAIECWGASENVVADEPLGAFLALDLGINAACAIDTDNGLSCWGDSGDAIVDAPEGSYADVCVASSSQACALDEGGALDCWGSYWWLLGSDPPIGQVFDSIDCTARFGCGLHDGEITCWGKSDSGTYFSLPGTDYVAFATGYEAVCGIGVDGALDCQGQADATDHPGGSYEAVGLGVYQGYGIDTAGVLTGWGVDNNNLLPPPSSTNAYESVEGGYYHACAVEVTGAASCWGCPSTQDEGQCDVPEI